MSLTNQTNGSFQTAGDCPDVASAAEQNATVPLSARGCEATSTGDLTPSDEVLRSPAVDWGHRLDSIGDEPIFRPALPPLPPSARQLKIFGVQLQDMTFDDALALLEVLLLDETSVPRTLYFVNAHTLNWAHFSDDYRAVLNRSDYVFGDGTGVRWAARWQGLRLQANLNGTDLIPAFFHAAAVHRFRYYLLGSTAETIRHTAQVLTQTHPDWELAGFHHGYLHAGNTAAVIRDINDACPHLLMVGMGNPLQECWIDEHRALLNVRLCVGVGALFGYWCGELERAPAWFRKMGYEWLWVLFRQRHKWKRYVFGNPMFLWRLAMERLFKYPRRLYEDQPQG